MILQHFLVTIILGSIFYIGMRYGDSSTKWAHLFFVGGISMILLICYWIFYFLKFLIICI